MSFPACCSAARLRGRGGFDAVEVFFVETWFARLALAPLQRVSHARLVRTATGFVMLTMCGAYVA